MTKLNLFIKIIENAYFLRVQTGTNYPQGGNNSHDRVTILKLIDKVGIAMKVKAKKWMFVDTESLFFPETLNVRLSLSHLNSQ